MKKSTLILALTLLVLSSLKGQDYVPFPTEKVNWNVYYRGTCNETPSDTMLIRYAIHGDTTINGIQYSKLCIESGDLDSPRIGVIGGLREIGKKIYYKGYTIVGAGNDEEFLLYDFTRQVGDTIWHDSHGGFHSVVLEIDSVLIGENFRKRYKVDNNWFYQNPDYIIEGIGSVKNGLLGHVSDLPTCGTHYWEHICFSENGAVKYLNPSYNECFPVELLSVIKQIDQANDFDIYPNPFTDQVIIKVTASNDYFIFKMFDINGRTVFEKSISSERVNFDVELLRGIYNAVIIDKDGEILYAKKMVKE